MYLNIHELTHFVVFIKTYLAPFRVFTNATNKITQGDQESQEIGGILTLIIATSLKTEEATG